MMQQLFIDGQLADLMDDTNVSFSIVSNLLTGAAEFKGNRTFTIDLPATVHNRHIIGMAHVVQSGSGFPYTFHNVDYLRDGVPIIQGGIGQLTSADPDKLHIAIVWGVRTAVDALLGSGKSLASLTTNAAITFWNDPSVSAYSDALVDDVFYAALDTQLHESENAYYHTHVVVGGASNDYSEERPASVLLHPSVRMEWILSLMESQYNAHIDWGSASPAIAKMIVPLVKKQPNDITFNYGYRASASEPSSMGGSGGNYLRFTTANQSPIIAILHGEMTQLVCTTAFSGLVHYSFVMYINEADLVSISRPVMRARYGYSIGLKVADEWHWCPIMPEGMTFLQDKVVGGRLMVYASGYLSVDMAVNDVLMVRIGITSNGVFDPDIASDLHVQGGPLYVTEIVGSENEVQPMQQYPVEGNLPDIKPVDLVKFLAAVTGMFPLQSSTADTMVMCPVSAVFDYSRAVDWSNRLLSHTNEPTPANKVFAVEGWAQRNWWRWKEDDTVAGDYDGSIDVDDDTLQAERNVMEFPFAASDGNNIPLYTIETRNGIREAKYKEVQPRVLTLDKGSDNEAVGNFDLDMKLVIGEHYGDLQATMRHPAIITETIRINDVELANVDESRPIYINQHGAYFALLELSVKGNGIADAKLLRLRKQEEI